MIVKETRIKTGSGHKALAAHVLRGKKNEVIRLLEGSQYWLKDWVKEAKREGLTYGLRHIAFNPEPAMTDGELSEFANRICEELKADKWLVDRSMIKLIVWCRRFRTSIDDGRLRLVWIRLAGFVLKHYTRFISTLGAPGRGRSFRCREQSKEDRCGTDGILISTRRGPFFQTNILQMTAGSSFSAGSRRPTRRFGC